MMKKLTDSCSICGDLSLIEVYPASDINQSATIEIDSSDYRCTSMAHHKKPLVSKCINCGVFQIPKSFQPKNLIEAYGEVVDEDYLDNFQIKKKTFSYAFKNIKKYIPRHSRLLEIGSYCGLFLNAAIEAGVKCTGIEPSLWAAAYSQSYLKEAKIINLPFESAIEVIDGPFDVIVTWDVIEHVANPNQMIRDINTLLKEGGFFIFSTINIDSLLAKIMGKKWHWIMDMHLYYFTHQSLSKLLKKAGFDLLETGGHRHYASLKYAYRKFCFCFSEGIANALLKFDLFIPNIMIPFTLGDVRYYVAIKRSET